MTQGSSTYETCRRKDAGIGVVPDSQRSPLRANVTVLLLEQGAMSTLAWTCLANVRRWRPTSHAHASVSVAPTGGQRATQSANVSRETNRLPRNAVYRYLGIGLSCFFLVVTSASAQTPAGAELPSLSWLQWPIRDKPAQADLLQVIRTGKPETDAARQFQQAGKYLYYRRCMPCHGATGQGDGPAAETLWPRPRDFTGKNNESQRPFFKFRTTLGEWLPGEDDLYRTISRGLTGTAMEGWEDVLTPVERWQIISYLKTFAPAVWTDPDQSMNPALALPEETDVQLNLDRVRVPTFSSQKVLTEGRRQFEMKGCWECHGWQARGDGQALGTHRDNWGYPAWPQNLTNAWNFKAGADAREIFRTLTTGMTGTVMPSYQDGLDSEDPENDERLRWLLAQYVASQVETPDIGKQVLVARLREGELPESPTDERWRDVQGITLAVSGQVVMAPRWQVPSVGQVTIQAVYNDRELALRLEWDDRRANVIHSEPEGFRWDGADPTPGPRTYALPGTRARPIVFSYRDAIELQWPARIPQTPERPYFLWGDSGHPVVLWRWMADRWWPRGPDGRPMPAQERLNHVPDSPQPAISRWYAQPEDSTAQPAVVEMPFANRVVREAGAFPTPAITEGLPSTVRSQARWENGSWSLVMRRPLVTYETQQQEGKQVRVPRSQDIQFATETASGTLEVTGDLVPLAVHVWDGAAGEDGLRMGMTAWYFLQFAKPTPARVYVFAVLAAAATGLLEGWLVWWVRRRPLRDTIAK